MDKASTDQTFRMRVDQGPRVGAARITVENLAALCRYLLLRFHHPNLRTGTFFIGSGSKISIEPQARIRFGYGVGFARNFTGHFRGQVTFGDNVFFSHGSTVSIHSSLVIGHDCLFGELVSIHDNDHVYGQGMRPVGRSGFASSSIEIGNNVWAGAKVTILQGVHIGNNVVIGANAVVTHDIPANTVAVGIPARVIRQL